MLFESKRAEFEKLVLYYIERTSNFLNFRHSDFEYLEHKEHFKFLNEYFSSNNKSLNLISKNEILNYFQDNDLIKRAIQNDNFEAIKLIILKFQEHIRKKNLIFKIISEDMSNVNIFNLVKSLEYDILKPKNLSEIELKEKEILETGIPPIDELKIFKNSFITFCALAKSGKTTLLCDLAVSLSKKYKDKKIIYITLELNEEEIALKMTKNVFEIPDIQKIKSELQKITDEIFEDEKFYPFNIDIKYLSSQQATFENILALSSQYDIIIIDYADKIKKNQNIEKWEWLGEIYDNLLSLSREKLLVATASQLNRTALQNLEKGNSLGLSSIAFSFEKIMIADSVFIIEPFKYKEKKGLILKLEFSRFSQSGIFSKPFYPDFEISKIFKKYIEDDLLDLEINNQKKGKRKNAII